MTGPPERSSPGAAQTATGANHFTNHPHPELTVIPADWQPERGPRLLADIVAGLMADLARRPEARP